MNSLYDSVKVIKGIGNKKAEVLSKINIHTIEDILYYFPKDYLDKSKLTKIKDIRPYGYYNFIGIINSKPFISRSRKGLLLTKYSVEDETGTIGIIFYNNRFAKSLFKKGDRIVFSGKTIYMNNTIFMEVPEYENCSPDNIHSMRIVPEYKLTKGLSQKELRKFIYLSLDYIGNMMIEIFPKEFRSKFNLAEINFALKNIHFPDSIHTLEIAKRRLKFEEIFMLQTSLMYIKSSIAQSNIGFSMNEQDYIFDYLKKLPYTLTNAQKRVLLEILNDMKAKNPMNRLLQGDVGSGKTVIGFLALLNCVRSGFQGVLMAPTEILAIQHFKTIKEFLEIDTSYFKVELLTASVKIKKRNQILRETKEGKINILIGTHALLNEEVVFNNIGLVITDEQHRFGVRQRAVLQSKGENIDMIVMSATPIPRTLALVIYGDLDISIIDELPPNRKCIETYFIDSEKKNRMFKFIKALLDEGRQAFFVCPLVEESKKLDLVSAKEYYDYLRTKHFKGYGVSLIYGKMKNSEKEDVMRKFQTGETDIIVSTTVIEVGINIPNATIMVIENAECFGLAQLHQLRGRVGRGEHKSYCILVSDTKNELAIKRLKYMTKTSDGFKIAEKDLEFRGSGELLGFKQHGLPEFKLLDIFKDYEIIKNSKEAMNFLYKEKGLDHDLYKKMFNYLFQRFNELIEKVSLN